MGAATLFFFLSRSQVAPAYRTALKLTGLVTLIACYHSFRIFDSWVSAFSVAGNQVKPTGVPFNDAYRYVDWLLTVPLLLVELVLVMRLPPAETRSKGIRLGLLAALMVVLGYPGEVAADASTRLIWWAAAMVPFVIIVYDLLVAFATVSSQPGQARGLVSGARYVTIASWCCYPIVFLFPVLGLTGGGAVTAVQVGYSIADIVAKALFGVLIYMIAVRKSEAEGSGAAGMAAQAAE